MVAIMEFYKCNLQERDEELQLHLPILYSKFDECKHCSTMAMEINHCKKNSITSKNIKVAIDNYLENASRKIKVLRFISTHQQPLVAIKNIILHKL